MSLMVIPGCSFCPYGPDLWLHFRITRTGCPGLRGAEELTRVAQVRTVFFSLCRTGALLFFLFNWLGKELGSCDVNKENESLPKVKPAVRQSDVLIKWLSSGVDRVTVQEGESLGATGSRWGRKWLLKRANGRLSTAVSARCFQLHSNLRNFFFPCHYYPSTFELSWLYSEISSWDKISHCGSVLPTRSVEAANSPIGSLTYSSGSSSWNLSWDLQLFWSDGLLLFKIRDRLLAAKQEMVHCWFFFPTLWPKCETFHWGSRNHHMPRSSLCVQVTSLPRFPTQTQNKDLEVPVIGTHFQLTAKKKKNEIKWGGGNFLIISEIPIAGSVCLLSLDVEVGLSGEGRLERREAHPDFMAVI